MNIAYLKTERQPEEEACGFEAATPAHFRGFVHGYADVPYHWHREMEILFVLRGSIRLVVDGQACEMNREDLILINADVPHNSSPTSRDALVCGAHLDAAHFERLGLAGFSSRHYLCRTFLHSSSFMHKVAPMKALMARLVLDQINQPEETLVRQTVASLLATYIYRWIAFDKENASDVALRADSRTRILRIMDTLGGYEDNRHLSAIAEAEGLTLSHLSRLFKRHVGIGYRDYSQNLRLDKSAEELRMSDDTIGIVMERNGFGNPAVFYNKFRARFGCSPAEFRRGRRSPAPQSLLGEADTLEAQRLLTAHAAHIGKAAELAAGFEGRGKRRILLNGPHQGITQQ